MRYSYLYRAIFVFAFPLCCKATSPFTSWDDVYRNSDVIVIVMVRDVEVTWRKLPDGTEILERQPPLYRLQILRTLKGSCPETIVVALKDNRPRWDASEAHLGGTNAFVARSQEASHLILRMLGTYFLCLTKNESSGVQSWSQVDIEGGLFPVHGGFNFETLLDKSFQQSAEILLKDYAENARGDLDFVKGYTNYLSKSK
jgi:hypothetical protein